MTVEPAPVPRVKGYLIQFLMVLSINVPTVSFGLAMGWVSLASGAGAAEGGGALVGAAAATFAAGLGGVPLGARALLLGRRPALAATSAAFAVCWALTLAGGWWLVAGRLCAGVAGAVAWCIAPLLGREMISGGAGGAAAAAPVLAHNLGMLLMYLAAYAQLQHSTVVACCLALSVLHVGVTLLAPESPAYLAAKGRYKEAVAALAWLRGVERDHPALAAELRALPAPDHSAHAPLSLAREMLSDRRRRRAFIIALIAVVGQEACGVLTLLQFAERVFVLASEDEPGGEGAGAGGEEAGAARHALVLGGVQFVAAAVALYLLERVGRRPLVVWGAGVTGACLALGAVSTRAGLGAGWAGGALGAAVAADSLGLQPAPYAILADMFHYQYRGCAVLLVMFAASAGNAAETLVFPGVVRAAGLWAALALAAAATLLYALFALLYIPETRNRTPEEIYDAICPRTPDEEAADTQTNKRDLTRNGDNKPVNTVATVDLQASHTVGDAVNGLDGPEPQSNLCTSSCNEEGRRVEHASIENIDGESKNAITDVLCERANESYESETVLKNSDVDEVTDYTETTKTSAVLLETSNELCAEETQCTNL